MKRLALLAFAGTINCVRDIAPLLSGEAKEWNDDFDAENFTIQQLQTHLRMLRTPEWKLIRGFNNGGRNELYHLAPECEETRNVIADSIAKDRRRDAPRPYTHSLISNLTASTPVRCSPTNSGFALVPSTTEEAEGNGAVGGGRAG